MKDAIRAAAQAAWEEVAQEVLRDSFVFVPVLSGDLLRSGRIEVTHTGFALQSVRISVVYGGNAIGYAETQHEDPYNHPSLGFFGAAKYLERPWTLNAVFYQELWKFAFDRALQQRLGQ